MKKVILTFLAHFIRIICELFSKLLGLRYRNYKHEPLPPISNLLLVEPATSLAQKIRNKKVTSEDVVKSFIARIKEINPFLNAVVDQKYEEALKIARDCDEYIRSKDFDENCLSKSKPFYGVPFTTKDCMKVKGLHQTAGLYARKDFVADSDADCVHLMQEAGAIVMAVTNVSELCMWWESSNTIYGRTNNPYNYTRIVGGSSGGEACLQSACGSPMGIGSDIGGSIRMPSFFNGVFGHKASPGIVSNLGQEPVAVGKLCDYLATGPICKFAVDLIPTLKVLAASNVHLLSLDKKVDLKSLKVYYMEDNCGNPLSTPVQKELRLAQRRLIDYLKHAHKITPVKVNLHRFSDSINIFLTNMGNVKEAVSFSSELALKKDEVNVWLELVKCIFRVSKYTLPGLALGIMNKAKPSEDHIMKTVARSDKLQRQLKEMLGDDGVFLYPSHPTVAPMHGQPLLKAFNFNYTSIFNIMELPVTQCPLGLNSEGLPMGIQVVGNLHQDHLCLAMAAEIELAMGGWVCPSQVF